MEGCMRIHLPAHHAHGEADNPFQGEAAHYDWVARHLMRRPYRRIAADATAALPAGASVLDVGTGPGLLLVELARMRPDLRITGVDLATDMVETARRNLSSFADRTTAVVGDVSDLPFEDDSFDLVMSTLSLHHWGDPSAGGAELARVLRAGGQIRIYDLRSAPFAALCAGATGSDGGVEPSRFRITPLPRPTLRRLVLPSGDRPAPQPG
jgi:ubiquinone/menaquinone biosynthesis C-methylase UbiE